jgi:hypothetical protein
MNYKQIQQSLEKQWAKFSDTKLTTYADKRFCKHCEHNCDNKVCSYQLVSPKRKYQCAREYAKTKGGEKK